jgi:hypothetical protein
MRAVRRASLRELASAAYELDAKVAEGTLRRSNDGRWMIGTTPLDRMLEQFAQQEVHIIVASLEDDRPLPAKVCRTCGDEYEGAMCPRCQAVRARLRGG